MKYFFGYMKEEKKKQKRQRDYPLTKATPSIRVKSNS
jgi:hypothetical protein